MLLRAILMLWRQTRVLAAILKLVTTVQGLAWLMQMEMGYATHLRFPVAPKPRPVITMPVRRMMMVLVPNWMHVASVVAMAFRRAHVIVKAMCSMLVGSAVATASLRVHATATVTSWMLVGFAEVMAFLRVPATVQGMFWMPAVFVVDRA